MTILEERFYNLACSFFKPKKNKVKAIIVDADDREKLNLQLQEETKGINVVSTNTSVLNNGKILITIVYNIE